VTSSEQALVDIETTSLDSMPSEDEVISVLRRLREDIDDLQGLIMDEGLVLEGLLEILPSLSKPLKYIDIDLSILPVEEREVEKANLSYDGKLVIYRKDGNLQVINLIDKDHRELLSKVVKDALPKLRELLNDPEMFKEPEPEPEQVVESIPEPVKIEPEPMELEPLVIDEPEPTVIEPMVAPEPEPVIHDPVVELPVEPEPTQEIEPEPVVIPREPEPTVEPVVKPKPIVTKVPQLPKRGAVPLRKLRSRVHKQNEVTRKQMDIIKRVREEKIRDLREETDNTEPEWVESKGIMDKVKKFFKRFGIG
jgi:hypothetical protein